MKSKSSFKKNTLKNSSKMDPNEELQARRELLSKQPKSSAEIIIASQASQIGISNYKRISLPVEFIRLPSFTVVGRHVLFANVPIFWQT
jgi:hypothetical protein